MNFKVVFVALFLFACSAQAEHAYIWSKIPFARGADLCQYKDAYGQSRTEYVATMVRLSTSLMRAGSSSWGALNLLRAFDETYKKNLHLAVQNKYLDTTLEATLKSYIDGYYRALRPNKQSVKFITGAANSLSAVPFNYIATGTYTLAPNCKGDILVTITLRGRDGVERNYEGHAAPSVVMSRIASKIFEDFQRTQFPSSVKVGAKFLTLVGGLNGSVDSASSPKLAKQSCETLDARLPDDVELEILNTYGDWSGGVSLDGAVWALPTGKVFAPMLRKPSPIRDISEVNATEFKYYCVRD